MDKSNFLEQEQEILCNKVHRQVKGQTHGDRIMENILDYYLDYIKNSFKSLRKRQFNRNICKIYELAIQRGLC